MKNQKRKFIFGCTDLAQLLYANLIDLGDKSVEAFVTHSRYRQSSSLMGLPVVTFEEADACLPPSEFTCYVCVGYSGMNRHRKDIVRALENSGYEILGFKHPQAFIKAITIGRGNIFFANTVVDFFSEIGSYNIFYPGSILSHHSSMGDFNFFAVAACVAGHCKIGNGNFIGANSTVANNIEITDHCLVGAGAYLNRNLENSQVFVPVRGLIMSNKTGEDFL